MRHFISYILALIGLSSLLGLGGCASSKDGDPILPPSPMERPAAFGTPVYGNADFPVTEAGFQLGRALFYDPALSLDSSVSCASCHTASSAFADEGRAVSNGINNRPTGRNSPTIQNLAWRTGFMWDGGINHLEAQPIAPISNPGEMGPSFADVVAKVQRYPRYKVLTKAAFGTDTLNSQRFLKGLAQFMATLVSANSRYDAFMKGDSDQLSTQERLGLQVFTNKGCNGCHKAPLFTNNGLHNNGLDDYSIDGGRFVISRNENDRGKFLVPSLRNIAKTGPYMHDGRFTTLEDVIAFYRTGIQASLTTDPSLPTGGVSMTQPEADALIAFLKSLTDEAFLANPKYRKP